MTSIDLGSVVALYRRYADDLAVVGAAQRDLLASGALMPQLDDLEAEITYLLLRATRPEVVVELGALHGWSTSWILRALHDNGTGHLHSFDRVDDAVRRVPADLAGDRWTFVAGDITATLDRVPRDTGYLFVDAAHHARFARWYLQHLFPLVPAEVPVSVHDVFHGRRTLPFTEGRVVLRWLAERDVPWFTPSRARARATSDALNAVRDELGLAPVRGRGDNPMIYFRMPCPPGSA